MRSLRARVTLASALAGLLVLGAFGIAFVAQFSAHELDDLDRSLARGIHDVEEEAYGPNAHGHQTPLFDQEGRYPRIYSESGSLVVYGDGPGELDRAPHGYSDQVVDGQRWRVYVETSHIGNEDWGLADIQVAMSTAEMDARVARARTVTIALVLLGAAALALAAWWISGAALSPLPRLRERADDLARGDDLTGRLPDDGPPEVAETASALNRMLDRTQISYRAARAALHATRTFTADAGHELRTPLTSLRANLDVLARDDLGPGDRERALRDSLAAHARLTALIEGLQTLARGDADAVAARSGRVDLAELADAAVLDARRRHGDVAFELEAGAQAPVEGDANGLRMLLDNLLENAAVHGGRRVRVNLAARDGYVRLSVDDDGPGIPDVEKGRVFERFARGSAARNGTGSGLGLAIAAQQAELHGAKLKLDDSPLGGARFELMLSAPSS